MNAVFLNGGGSLITPGIDLSVNLYFALHTAAPVDNQTETECAYGGYARVAVVRDIVSFDFTDGTYPNAIVLQVRKSFPQASSGSSTATHWSIGINASGTSFALYIDELTTPISITAGVTPYIDAGTLIREA